MTPALIYLVDLRAILNNVLIVIHKYLRLPSNPDTDIRSFYDFLKAHPLIMNDMLNYTFNCTPCRQYIPLVNVSSMQCPSGQYHALQDSDNRSNKSLPGYNRWWAIIYPNNRHGQYEMPCLLRDTTDPY